MIIRTKAMSTSTYSRRFVFVMILVTLTLPAPIFGYTLAGGTYTTDGSQSDVASAIANASAGDTVLIPAGSFTWGANGTFVSVNKPITLAGAGTSSTTIVIASNAGTFSNATIRISAAAVVRSFKVQQTGGAATSGFAATTTNGWRITDIVYSAAPTTPHGYFVYCSTYGLIDNCTVNGGGGPNELVFARGPADSWQTPSSTGTANALFIEGCTFTNGGYVCDINANGRAVVRFCTITGALVVDGHGVASNSPARSVRHMEVYGNRWTTSAQFTTAIEIRGGSGFLFDNTSENQTANRLWFYLTDYGYTASWPNFGNTYQTPVDYPVKDQIGVGIDPKVAGSEPLYLWNNLAAASSGAGVATLDWGLSWKAIPAAAITLYRTQTANPTATFTMQDVIAADRDYFKHTLGATFNGSSGIGRGTKAQMLSLAPTKSGVGFWVTDEGEWNTSQNGPDGQLYAWNGSAWVLKYIPYTYPHPMRRPIAPSNLRLAP